MSRRVLSLAGLAVLFVCACSSSKGGLGDADPPDDGGVDAGAEGGTPNDRDATADARRPGPSNDGAVLDAAEDGGVVPSGCQPTCGAGQRCEQTASGPTCVDIPCGELDCGVLGECAPATGGGNVCKSIACTSDVQCGDERYCDGTKCVADACIAGTLECQSGKVFACGSNGSVDPDPQACGGFAYHQSACSEDSPSGTGCTCEDDWDCPTFMSCNAGTCQGTGVAPTCTLPPVPFEQVLPSLEFRWGGASTANKAVTGSPFPAHGQVVMTPVVANLDDDNGDGLINELDFPEIVFISYSTDVHRNAVVRAVHGGGSTRGKDYFALCGETKHWFEGDTLAAVASCSDAEAILRSGGGLAAGDLDYDGIPEIVVATELGTIMILDNRGNVLSKSDKEFYAFGDASPNVSAWRYPQVALANLDNTGFAELIVGNRVFTLHKPPNQKIQVRDVFVGQAAEGAQGDTDREFGPVVCPANLIDADPSDADVSQEIVVGSTLYALPTPPAGVTSQGGCAPTDTSAFCTGRLNTIWNARVVNGATAIPNVEGFCAVADVLGADTMQAPGPANPLDRVPEVILVSNGRLLIVKASDGTLIRKVDVEPGQRGGAPNVDDFDGDGFPEIAMASSGFYTVIDLQEPNASSCPAWPNSLGATPPAPSNPARNPGQASCTSSAQCNAGATCSANKCVCLHNGWKRVTEDDSSRATSSSVFDFNGDGAAEVVYGDECYFRVYDGASGNVRLAIPSLSRTVLENPVVADVDNDGNAEIVFVNNNETLQCSQTTLNTPDPGSPTVARSALPNGLQVWGDESDTWVSARRVWNQHAYHVTNVTEGGHIPLREPESWRPYGNRFYNTYRSQPRSFGVAPDLALTAMQLSSPDVACGAFSELLEIVVQVKNLGDLRVGPGVALTFYGDFAGGISEALRTQTNMPLTSTLTTSLEPGASVLVKVSYRAADSTSMELPTRIIARVDEADAERECIENNNEVSAAVDAGEMLADLELAILAQSGPCTSKTVSVRVRNDGSVAAGNVLVRLYAGDPSAGGQAIGEATIAGPIPPGTAMDTQVPVGALDRTITVWGVADPLDSIEECNNVNNIAQGPEISCSVVVI